MIEVVNISKKYGSKQALSNVSFNIKRGEIVGLLGLNGAGKSTIMNIMTGYLSADSGYAKIGDYDISLEPLKAKRMIGYLPEQFFFYSDMKVLEYLNFICDIKKVNKNRKKHIYDICSRVGISHILDRMIKNLSKGYRQRVGLVQSLLGDPEVVILDEPTVGLDPSQVVDIRTLIKDVGKQRTVIISSHILSEIQLICSRVILLNNGKVIADDTPDNLRKSMSKRNKIIANIAGKEKQVQQALLGKSNILSVAMLSQKEPGVYEYIIEGKPDSDIRVELFEGLADAKLPALSLNANNFTLEDYFLKNTNTDRNDDLKEDAADVGHL